MVEVGLGGAGGGSGAAPTAAECDKMQSGILCPLGPELAQRKNM